MRAFIIRNEESIPLLQEAITDIENEEYWMFVSGESFPGIKSGKFFKFMDHRLPDFKLPLKYIKIEN